MIGGLVKLSRRKLKLVSSTKAATGETGTRPLYQDG